MIYSGQPNVDATMDFCSYSINEKDLNLVLDAANLRRKSSSPTWGARLDVLELTMLRKSRE